MNVGKPKPKPAPKPTSKAPAAKPKPTSSGGKKFVSAPKNIASGTTKNCFKFSKDWMVLTREAERDFVTDVVETVDYC